MTVVVMVSIPSIAFGSSQLQYSLVSASPQTQITDFFNGIIQFFNSLFHSISPVSTPIINPCKEDLKEYEDIVYNVPQDRDGRSLLSLKQQVDWQNLLQKIPGDCKGVSSGQQIQWMQEAAKEFAPSNPK